jgi:hypothetical protein
MPSGRPEEAFRFRLIAFIGNSDVVDPDRPCSITLPDDIHVTSSKRIPPLHQPQQLFTLP